MAFEMYRERVVEMARSWIGTPFELNAAVKGPKGGVDCLRLIGCSFAEAGLLPMPDGGPWPHVNPQTPQTAKEDVFANCILRHCAEVSGPPEFDLEPGDIILIRTKDDLWSSHGALVVGWPRIIHVWSRGLGRFHNVHEDDGPSLLKACCPRAGTGSARFFDFFAKEH